MEQLVDLKRDRKLVGCHGSELCDGSKIAVEAWGDRAEEGDGLSSFAYLWRRFGPPFYGSDSYKDVASYRLTTEDPQVFLWISPRPSAMAYNVGYMVDKEIEQEYWKPASDWQKELQSWVWKKYPELKVLAKDGPEGKTNAAEMYWKLVSDKDVMKKATRAIGASPRRAYSEDWRTSTVPRRRVNQAILDACKELLRPVYVRDSCFDIFGSCEEGKLAPAEPSEYAGYGIPIKPMKAIVKKYKQ